MLHFVNSGVLYLLDISSRSRTVPSYLSSLQMWSTLWWLQIPRSYKSWYRVAHVTLQPISANVYLLQSKYDITARKLAQVQVVPGQWYVKEKPHAHSLLDLAFVTRQILCFIGVVTMWTVGSLLLYASAVWRHCSVERCLSCLYNGAMMRTATMNTLAWVFLWVWDLYFLGQTRRC